MEEDFSRHLGLYLFKYTLCGTQLSIRSGLGLSHLAVLGGIRSTQFSDSGLDVKHGLGAMTFVVVIGIGKGDVCLF